MNTLEAGLAAMKQGFDAQNNKDTEKLKMVWNYKTNTIQVYLKFAGEAEAFSPGPVPMKEDKESVQMGEMLLGNLKGKMKDCKQIDFMQITFDLIKNSIEAHDLFYIDTFNQKKKISNGN